MTPHPPAVGADDLATWCETHLGSPPAHELFRSGHLSVVIGLRLVDHREVVVKVRPPSARTAGCVAVQQRLFERGYPCPAPLAGPAPLGEGVATAEAHVPGGDVVPGAEHAARLSAEAFARLVTLAPRATEVPSLDPPPSWVAWDRGEASWPVPEGDEVDLGAAPGRGWIDEAASRARDRLRADRGGDAVVGHCDWLVENVRWRGAELLVVHDWDSAVVESEAVLVGLAAALWSPVGPERLATVEETQRFLDAYGAARPMSRDDLERAWAAGVWTRAYDARYQHVTGNPVTSLTEAGAGERLRRAGTG